MSSVPSTVEIRNSVASRSDWAQRLLQELIRIDSVAPAENDCQQALARLLAREELRVKIIPLDLPHLKSLPGFVNTGQSLTNRPNLVATFGQGLKGRKTLIINGHIDTVAWADQLSKWCHHPLSGTVEKGVIYGRGAVDDKGPLVAAILAILALKDLGWEPDGQVILESVVDEEPGGNGTLDLCGRGFRGDAAIVLEPTDNNLIRGHRGILGLQLDTYGQARHGSISGLEGNVILEAAAVLSEMQKALVDWSHPADEKYGPPSLNIGRIQGGDDIFTTPLHCRVDIGVRYAPGSAELLVKHLEDFLLTLQPKISLSHVEHNFFCHYDASEAPPEATWVIQLLDCIRQVQPNRVLGVFPGCCDARHFNNRYGIQAVIFGPGRLEQAHAENESLPLTELIAAGETLALFIREFCQ